ncbi:hypothetical protein H9660_05430 [Clostridium sp. Sa3CUN1]|uniref:DNA phosphorothioation-dependent restriction protein DptF n=1 Tax=Clostridium gallinarum TaxID=2762246 RepID=A0ABR8Q2F8_9CLOT|nr:hypothetical protein [Clostridium gallinarum]MBD7914580.1 hypothetical protein [Clostridium gallinarum]
MGNEFVNYLNSMNNATSGNINALAESQVINKYYNYIRVDRKLGEFIVKKINANEKSCYILTGHAGDGKTSILIQVLKSLNLLPEGERLKVVDTVSNEFCTLKYVKDMSELSEEKQIKLLKECLEAPQNGMSSILITNTGPLIKSFNILFGEGNDEKIDKIENMLLKQLDENSIEELKVNENRFNLINIARIENLNFARKVIEKICSDELWGKCRDCINECKCPIYFNKKCVSDNKERVIDFVETFYRWLQENDKRITIRQMIAQISFAFTGNINCERISKFDNRLYNNFNYNFANLFFGYKGIQEIYEAKQIKGIELIQEMKIDSVALREDYNIFVKGDFSYLKPDIRIIVESLWNKFSKEVFIGDYCDSKYIDKQNEIRKAIRRFILVFGLSEQENGVSELYNQVYGKVFNMYKSAITEKHTPRKLRAISKMIYEALYIKNIGVPPIDEDTLYLTLARYDGDFQKVFLLLGKAKERNLVVNQVVRNVEIEDTDGGYKLVLQICKEDGIVNEKVNLSLPLLMYFYSIGNGEISTEINPSLSHGVAELNAKLLKVFRFKEKEKQLSLIVNTVSGAKEIKIEFEDNKMFVL